MLRGTASSPLQPTPTDDYAQRLLAGISRLRSGTSKLLYHHVKKSGGTALCESIAAGHMPTWSCSKNTTVVSYHYGNDSDDIIGCNCNGPYRPHQGPFSLLHTEGQRQVLEQYANAAIFFNEGPLSDDPLFGPELFQFTIIRHPVTRFLSHWLHAVSRPHTLLEDALRVRLLCACPLRAVCVKSSRSACVRMLHPISCHADIHFNRRSRA